MTFALTAMSACLFSLRQMKHLKHCLLDGRCAPSVWRGPHVRILTFLGLRLRLLPALKRAHEASPLLHQSVERAQFLARRLDLVSPTRRRGSRAVPASAIRSWFSRFTARLMISVFSAKTRGVARGSTPACYTVSVEVSEDLTRTAIHARNPGTDASTAPGDGLRFANVSALLFRTPESS